MCRLKHSDKKTTRLVKNDLGVELKANLYLIRAFRGVLLREISTDVSLHSNKFIPCMLWPKFSYILANLSAIKPLVVCFSS